MIQKPTLYKDKFSLKDQVVIVTGALGLIASSFIEALLQFEAQVALLDLDADRLSEKTKELQKVYPASSFKAYPVDVTKKKEIQAALEAILKDFSHVNALVNTHQNKTPAFFDAFEEYTEENWHQVLETNLTGTFLTCQVIGGWMASKGGGNIVNLPSLYALVAPNPRLYHQTSLNCPAAYAASKGGVVALTQYLSTYWASKKVRVNLLTPHGVWNQHEKNFETNFAQFSPLGRMSYSHEVSGALIYLLSEASSYVTGQNLVIDGGWTAW